MAWETEPSAGSRGRQQNGEPEPGRGGPTIPRPPHRGDTRHARPRGPTRGSRRRGLRFLRRTVHAAPRRGFHWRAGCGQSTHRELPWFPDGITGEELTSRGVTQAQKFGETVSTPSAVDGLEPAENLICVYLADGTDVHARAAVLATGARYRRLALPGWHNFEGAGIFFAATKIEAEYCQGNPVIVVGGANASGQAALFLASRTNQVDLVIRGDKLETGMSDYLARRIREHPRIETHLSTEVTALHGHHELSGVDLTHRSDGTVHQLMTLGVAIAGSFLDVKVME